MFISVWIERYRNSIRRKGFRSLKFYEQEKHWEIYSAAAATWPRWPEDRSKSPDIGQVNQKADQVLVKDTMYSSLNLRVTNQWVICTFYDSLCPFQAGLYSVIFLFFSTNINWIVDAFYGAMERKTVLLIYRCSDWEKLYPWKRTGGKVMFF